MAGIRAGIRKEEIETPALLIDMDLLEYNIKLMSDYMKEKKAKLRPHYKTFKCPTIAHMQLRDGAKGICCAKLGEAETLVKAGIQDVLIANQVIDPVKIWRLAGLARIAKLSVAVDNPENVKELSRAAKEHGSTIYVLIEVDVGMKRCGINTGEEAYNLARLISDSEGLVFEGIQAYEGHVILNPDINARRRGVEEMVKKVGGIKDFLEKKGIGVNEISGGGTGTYNITGDNTIWTEIQAGSYVFMDTSYNQLGLGFKNSLTVYTEVIHKRKGMAITDAGMKACTTDHGMPVIKGYPAMSVQLHEEHGLITDQKDELSYMQKIEYIPGHCCTTVNLYDQYYCVRNDLLEAVWPITGRGMCR
ncbi:MAG: DSD1 family PLP-dependent enzyme [Spirochaetota bacterium]